MDLNQTGLFYLNNFSSEAKLIYKKMLEEQKKRRANLKSEKENISVKSQRGAKAVNLGVILERLVLTFDNFNFNRNDCRSLFDPIDYVIFEGLTQKQKVEKIIFVDIKTGTARLTSTQRSVKSLIEDKKVEFKTYKS